MTYIEKKIHKSTVEDCRELHSEQADSIIMRVRECSENRYEADFRLTLSGVSNYSKESEPRDQRNRNVWIDNSIRALLSGLRNGQTLDFNYGWRHEVGKAQRFDWEITGTNMDVDGPDALNGARDLHHSLQVMLGNPELGFKFTSVKSANMESSAVPKWAYVLEPAAITIPLTKKDVGYTGSHATDQQIILTYPMSSNELKFDSVIYSGVASPATFTVSIRITAYTLTQVDIDAFKVAFDQLRMGEVGQIRQKGTKSGCIYDERIVASTLNRLERWLGDPRGYQAKCMVRSDRPLPTSLLEIIGRELFCAVPISVRRINNSCLIEEQEESSHIDLTGCFHYSDSPLNILPRTESLLHMGIPRLYTSAPKGFSSKGIVLGKCEQQHTTSSVKLTIPDRSRHCYLIGATGTGKTTLLNNMINQDVERGEGLCVIDPHGDLHKQVLGKIPEHRANDVILMDLADLKYSVGLNFLECNGANKVLQRNYIVNEMMSIFHRLYDMNVSGGPVFESYMRNALLAVMSNEHRTATLLDVVRFFEDEKFRLYIKDICNDPLVVSFWNQQAEKAGGDYALTNMGPYITTKLNQFTHNALLRPIIGQTKSTIDFKKAMDQGKIILVNLAKGLLGEFDARLLGMLLIGKIFDASLSRISMDESKRRPFYLYIDEFQNIATPSIIGLVSEARKFGLSLIMANQHLGQFSEENKMEGVADAIMANVGTMLFFRTGPKDAEKLETYTKPYFDAQDLQHLPDHHVACRMLSNNVPVPSFVFKTLQIQFADLDNEKQEKITKSIRRRSRRVYARNRDKVDASIKQKWIAKISNSKQNEIQS